MAAILGIPAANFGVHTGPVREVLRHAAQMRISKAEMQQIAAMVNRHQKTAVQQRLISTAQTATQLIEAIDTLPTQPTVQRQTTAFAAGDSDGYQAYTNTEVR